MPFLPNAQWAVEWPGGNFIRILKGHRKRFRNRRRTPFRAESWSEAVLKSRWDCLSHSGPTASPRPVPALAQLAQPTQAGGPGVTCTDRHQLCPPMGLPILRLGLQRCPKVVPQPSRIRRPRPSRLWGRSQLSLIGPYK